MITIAHLSDFHMNNHTLYDWENYLKDSMVEVIKDKMIDAEHTIIVCTGDLIDKAGKDFGGIEPALSKFKEKVIDVLMQETGISLDHFVIIPGNHDINRSKDDDYENLGLIAKFTKEGYWAVNDYATEILNGPERKSTKRCIEYKNFEKKLYDGLGNVQPTFLGTTFKYEIDGLKIGIAAYNSSWCAYDDNDYEHGMYLSEPQYNNSFREIRDFDIRIALMHHPLDWLKLEKDTVGAMFYRNYNILLVGHVHEGETTFENKMYGSLFSHIAPCFTNEIRSDSKSFANGFSILEYDYDGRKVNCSYYSYKKIGKYTLNTDYTENGTKEFCLQNLRDSSLQGIIDSAIKYVKKEQCPKFDERLIPQRAQAIQTVKDAFVVPPIVKQGDEDDAPLCTLNDIIANPEKVLLFGPHESGKSILLYRLLGEYVDNYHQHNLVPVYIDYKSIGNQNIETIVKSFIDCNSNETKQLLANKAVVLLLDNYMPSVESRHNVNKVHDFVVGYGIKVIATSVSSIVGIVPMSFSNGINNVAFEYYFIDHFKAENVKQLMVKWTPADETLKRNTKIEKMVANFCSYSLPCTAMSVSLYLWSTENAEKEPVNQAVLLDIYIEIMLEKLSAENVYHNTFDYHNKTMLLSRLAFEFYDSKTTEMSYGAYIDWIDNYLKKSVGYTQFDAERLGNYLIQQKIIKREGNIITFAHSCFYYFFLAKRMLDDDAFYNTVVSENYGDFDLVIGYYSGLKRNDKHLLSFLYDKFQKVFEPVQPIYDEVPVDKCFTQTRANSPKKFEPRVEKASMAQIVRAKPTEKKMEEKLLEVCDQKLSKISDDFKRHAVFSPDMLIVLLSKVLRNLDGVEDLTLKQNVYNSIIRNSLIYTIIYKDALANYANNHGGRLPALYSNVRNVDTFFRYMPFAIQWTLNEHMGTGKLCSVFLNKFYKDYKTGASDVEKYMSLGMLWDSANFRYEEQMKKFIKSVDKNSAMDYVYTKLLYNYYYRTKEGSKEEEMYEDLIIRLKLRKFRIGFIHKDKLRQELKEAKAMKGIGLLK